MVLFTSFLKKMSSFVKKMYCLCYIQKHRVLTVLLLTSVAQQVEQGRASSLVDNSVG